MAITCSRPVKNRINMYTKIFINLLEEEKFDHLQINDRTRVLHRSYLLLGVLRGWTTFNLCRRPLKFVFNPSIHFSFLSLSIHWNFWPRRPLKFVHKPFHSSPTSLAHSFTIITVLKSPHFLGLTKEQTLLRKQVAAEEEGEGIDLDEGALISADRGVINVFITFNPHVNNR